LNSRDNKLWLQSWRDRRIDFHQHAVNPFLARFWPGLKLPPGSRVFVPLCGKSLDMLWLARRGYDVIGVELSPVAVEAFFRENGLHPRRKKRGAFTLWQCDNITILCGDYFALTPAVLGRIDTVYDRAALTALPEDVRVAYVAHLRALVGRDTRVFLLTVEDAEAGESLAQALGVGEEITRLFAADFDIDLTHVESVFEADAEMTSGPDVRVEYKVYRLTSPNNLNC
jgi:thiopurine S-methyltransferase